MVIYLSLCFLLILPHPAWAYVDPGTGGYLISSILAAIGSFFALVSAFVIHFFRNVLGKGMAYLWAKQRPWLVLGVIAVVWAGGFFIYKFTCAPAMAKFDPRLSGAHTLDASKISAGYDLYDGQLMDNQGHVIKQWTNKYLGILDANGDYYAEKYFESPIWGRYTWEDKVVWEKFFPIHHELLLTPQGTLITFSKELHTYNGREVNFDVILEFDKDGDQLSRYSVWDHLKEFQQYHGKLELDMPPNFPLPSEHLIKNSIFGGQYDYYHLNALSVIPSNAREGRAPYYKKGNWLLSFRHGSMLFILDKDTKHVLWHAVFGQVKDNLEGPHAPVMLSDGQILVLDNGRYRKWSRIIKLDPENLRITWEYRQKNFYSLSQGYAQYLPNGNVLVTESEEGHVFELTPDKQKVWEYYGPLQQDSSNTDDESKWGLRQEIYRMIRYPKEMIDRLIQPPQPPGL